MWEGMCYESTRRQGRHRATGRAAGCGRPWAARDLGSGGQAACGRARALVSERTQPVRYRASSSRAPKPLSACRTVRAVRAVPCPRLFVHLLQPVTLALQPLNCYERLTPYAFTSKIIMNVTPRVYHLTNHDCNPPCRLLN